MFKALFGLQGTNTRTKFLLVNSLAWALLFILCIFIDESLIFYILILIPALVLYACLVRDSDKRPPEPLYYLLPLAFVIGALACGILSPIWALLPLVLSLPLWVQLARMAAASSRCGEYSSKAAQDTTHKQTQRVEPTFGLGANIEDLSPSNEDKTEPTDDQIPHNDHASTYTSSDDFKAQSLGKHTFYRICDDLKENVRVYPQLYVIAVIAAAMVLLMILVSTWIGPDKEELTNSDNYAVAIQQQDNSTPKYKVSLPDNFALGLEDEKLMLSWSGDEGKAASIWSLASAKGDRRCSELVFNDGSIYRPVDVLITKENITQAWFSPLDSKNIIRGIANYNNAKLCGYHFSLKGTKALLEGHHVFATYLQ